MSRFAAGVDIGGTSVKTGLFDEQLELVHNCTAVGTSSIRSADDMITRLLAAIETGLGEIGSNLGELAGVGIGSPGPLDIPGGKVVEAPNTPFLNGYPLTEAFSKAAGVPVWLDNDANVFVLGEALRGAGKGYDYVLGVTLGTGFGWGIVLDGSVYHGATGTAAEYGLSVWREEGHSWEDDVSIRGLMRVFHEKGGTAESPEEVNDLAAGGDEVALAAWREYGRVLGLSLSHGVNLIDPHVVVVGGAMAGAWDHFSPAMLETLRANIFTLPRERLKVVPSELGGLAALYGAASQVSFEEAS
ncbi:MAG: ROK family protein [Fidelibacterota bacterium]|nr:MAG: ROK family protein [Candidatus Neomarinimicrobiota bacterium]